MTASPPPFPPSADAPTCRCDRQIIEASPRGFWTCGRCSRVIVVDRQSAAAAPEREQ